MTRVGDKFLYGCTNLEYLKIGSGLNSTVSSGLNSTNYEFRFYIGEGSKLETLELAEGITGIGAYRFCNGYVNGNIKSYAFKNLKTVIFPSTLRTIGSCAFTGAQLTELNFPGEMNLESSAFSGMTTLKKVHIGAGEIPSYAFYGCTGLTSVELGEGVTAIGESAFENCTGLTSLVIPDSVTRVGDNFLYGCTNLTYLKIGSGLNETVSSGISYNSTQYSIFNIGADSRLETLELAEGITGIGSYRFCNGYYYPGGYSTSSGYHIDIFGKLKTVIFPSTLTTIDNGNLSNWGEVKHLYLGDGITSITESGALPSDATIYSNSYNSVLADFAQAKGVSYVYDEGTPSFKLTCVVPDPDSVTATAIAVSDGELVVASEVPGETVTLPEGYAILSEQDVAYHASFVPEAPQVPAGYVFRGWYTDIELINPLKLGVMPAADLTLYARIDAPVTVNYLAPLGTEDTQDETLPEGWKLFESYSLQAGEALPVPDENPEIAGYSFRGWYVDEAGTVPSSVHNTIPQNGAVFYAGFDRLTKIRYAVNLAAVGTADEDLPDGFYVYADYLLLPGSQTPVPGDPAPDGYVFEGWFDTPTFTNSYVRNVVLGDDITYYGKLSRMTAGGRYKAVDGGLQLVSYRPEEDEGTVVRIPARVNGQTVVSVGPNAFTGSEISTLYLPDTLTSIDPEAFSNSGIYNLYIGRACAAYSTLSGVLYNKDMTELLYYPAAKRNPSFTMPDTVTKIADRGFYRNPYLQSVTFSGNLVEIGEEAFSGCGALTEVTLPDSTTTLHKNAFYGCRAIETFTAYGLTVIETGADQKAETIPMSISKVYGPIGEGVLRDWFTYVSDGARYTFQYNQYPLTLILDGETESISNEAGMPLMDEVKNLKLGGGSFAQAWYRDAEMTQPWNFDTDVMPQEALTLYATKTALYGYEIGTVTVDEVEYTGLILTAYNGAGAEVVIPVSLNGEPVIGIGAGFLSGDSTTVTRITIGSHILNIDAGAMSAFNGTLVCDADSPASVWASEHAVNTSLLQYRLSFESEGQRIESKLNAKDVAVRLPVLTNNYRSFTGWFTDSACTMAAELDEDGLYVMPGADITLYAGWDRDVEAVPFTWTAENEQVTITGYTGSDTRITIPATVNGWPVVTVAEEAFENAEIKSIDLGPVTSIGEAAFRNCANLETVTMNTVTAVGEYAFSGCDNLRMLSFGAVLQTIGDMAFSGCEALGNVTLPDALTTLGSGAFNDCTGLKSLTLGSGLTSFPLNAVNGCTRLNAVNASVQNTALASLDGVLYNKAATMLLFYPVGKTEASFSVPGGVTAIGEGAFQNVTGLKQITVPETLTALEKTAFAGSGLTSFSASGLQTIGEDAFLGCTALETVNPGEKLQRIAAGAFAGCRNLTVITIPESAVLNPDEVIFTNHVTITGTMGSSAHDYALAYQIPFKDPNAVSVTAIALSETSLVLQRGESAQLTASLQPANAVLGTDLRWFSSDEAVAYVDETGLISALGGGTATIVALSSNGVRATCELEVQVAVTEISLDSSALELLPGATANLTATLNPASATNQTVLWTSSDESVVTVDGEGMLTATGEGRATIRATAHNGLYAETAVHVYIPSESLTLNVGDALCFVGDTLALSMSTVPENATYRTAVWSSSDESVATVDETGTVTALGAGTATVTAENEEGKRVTCSIRVVVVPENVLQLPAILSEVEEEAFRGTAAEYVVIPENTLSIGDYAFADSSSLILVEFLYGNTEIAEHAFDQCGLLGVIAPADGTVEAWANENGIPFRAQ